MKRGNRAVRGGHAQLAGGVSDRLYCGGFCLLCGVSVAERVSDVRVWVGIVFVVQEAARQLVGAEFVEGRRRF